MPASEPLAFVFPGQGSQHVGMGTDLAVASDPAFVRLVRRAEDVTGADLSRAMLAGPKERLDDTVATQLSVFIVSVALAERLAACGVRPDVVAGHSLGEWSALVAGGWVDADEALDAVARRAQAMAAACAAAAGAMSAVLGMAPDVLEGVRAEIGAAAVVANRNSPKQSVVAGAPAAVDALCAAALGRGASHVIPLSVAGAFHSPLMASAQAAFAPVVDGLALRRGAVPLVSSVTGALYDAACIARSSRARSPAPCAGSARCTR